RSRGSPRPAFRTRSCVRLCRLDYRCFANLSFLHRITADTRSDSRTHYSLLAKRSPVYGTRWTCFHIRPDGDSPPHILSAPVLLLPRSQCDTWKETHSVA